MTTIVNPAATVTIKKKYYQLFKKAFTLIVINLFVFYMLFYCNSKLPIYTFGMVIIPISYCLFWWRYKDQFYSPFNFFFFFQVVFSTAGLFVYQIREVYLYNYPSNMNLVSMACFISIIALIDARFIYDILHTNKVKRNLTIKMFDLKKINLISWIYIIIGLFASLILFDYGRNIPLLAMGIEKARVEISRYSPGRGTLFILQMLLVIAIPISYFHYRTRLKTNKKFPIPLRTAIFAFKIFLCFIPLTFYAGRFYILSPILLTIFTHNYFIKKISFIKFSVLGFIILSLAIVFVSFRIYGDKIYFHDLIQAFLEDLFSEMRMFGFVVNKTGNALLYKKMLLGTLVKFLPSAIFMVFGINKEKYLFQPGSFVAENTAGFNVPIRASLTGECYLAYGFIAVFTTFFLFGIILMIITNILNRLKYGDARLFLGSTFSIFMALTIPYGINMLPMVLFTCGFAYLVEKMTAGSKKLTHENTIN